MKRYSSSLLLTFLAALLGIFGVLSLTTWKPAQDVTATGSTEAPFLITRLGLFGLYGDGETVRLTATAQNPDEHIWLALGSPADVTAWVGEHSYEEIYGLVDIETLKMEPHLLAEDDAQSAEADAQDLEEAQSGEEIQSPIVSDMWDVELDGVGTLQMVISESQMDQVLLAATDGVSPAPSITLSWDTPSQNYAAMFLFSFAALFALLALFSWFTVWRRVRRRAKTRARLLAQVSADATQTSMIPAISTPATDVVVEEAVKVESPVEAVSEPSDDVEFAPEAVGAGAGIVEDEVAFEPEPALEGKTSDVSTDVVSEDEVAAGSVVADPVTEDVESVTPDQSAREASAKAEAPTGEAFLDRTQQLTTQSGLVNLSALQGGGKFPTRRALREAQARGVETLVVEGREFTTTSGSIPAVKEASSEAQETAAMLGRRSLRRVSRNETDGEVEDGA